MSQIADLKRKVKEKDKWIGELQKTIENRNREISEMKVFAKRRAYRVVELSIENRKLKINLFILFKTWLKKLFRKH